MATAVRDADALDLIDVIFVKCRGASQKEMRCGLSTGLRIVGQFPGSVTRAGEIAFWRPLEIKAAARPLALRHPTILAGL